MEIESLSETSLGEVADFKNGKTLSSERYSHGGKYPVFGSNGQIASTDEQPNSDACVVIGRVGAYCGSVHYVPRPAWVTDNAIIASPKSKHDLRFLYYLLGSLQLNRTAIGSAQPLMTQGGLKVIRVKIPSTTGQQRISILLGTLDDKIELNRRMNATLEAMARALFQSWFVDFDPVRAKAACQTPAGMDQATADLFPSEFEDSELGEIPKGWRVGLLGDVLTTTSKGVSVEEMDDTAAYIGLEHMPRRSIALDQWGTAAELQSNKSSFKRGDILFGKLRPYFHKVGIAPTDGVCSTDILVLSAKSPAFFGFVFCHCISDKLIAHTTALSNGAKMPRTKWPDLRDYKVVLPLEPLAKHFSEQLSPLLDRIISNIHESRTLAVLRDTLLPQLLSGKLPVAIPSIGEEL